MSGQGGKSDFLELIAAGTGSSPLDVTPSSSSDRGGTGSHLGAPGITVEVSGVVTHGLLRACLFELPQSAGLGISHLSLCMAAGWVVFPPAILGHVAGLVSVCSVFTVPENWMCLGWENSIPDAPCLNMVWSFVVPMLIKAPLGRKYGGGMEAGMVVKLWK